jgi:hypothetical protein
MEKDIPPMLAAQSDFPSGPLPSFHTYSINEFGDDPKIITPHPWKFAMMGWEGMDEPT